MTKEHSFVAGDYSDRDLYTSSRTRERALNSAIVRAEIRESFEEYLETFDAFYADEIEASNETVEEPVRGKAGVRSLLFNFLVPLHVMAVETDTCRRADEAVKRMREAVNHLCEYSHVEITLHWNEFIGNKRNKVILVDHHSLKWGILSVGRLRMSSDSNPKWTVYIVCSGVDPVGVVERAR